VDRAGSSGNQNCDRYKCRTGKQLMEPEDVTAATLLCSTTGKGSDHLLLSDCEQFRHCGTAGELQSQIRCRNSLFAHRMATLNNGDPVEAITQQF